MLVSPGIQDLQKFTNGEPGLISVRDAVSISPDMADAVVRADAASSEVQVVGFAFKVIADRVYVRRAGSVTGFLGLEQGAVYWLDPEVLGGIVTPAPEIDAYEVLTLHQVGIAKSPTELQVVLGVPSVISR